MKLVHMLSLSLCIVSAVQTTYAAPETAVRFKNQRGSMLTLELHPDKQKNTGTLSGTFTTAVGQCKTDVGVPLPISGFYNENALSITVNFPHCRQVVAMTGNLIKNKQELHTLWLHASPVDDPQGSHWNSNLVGSDSYHKIG